MDTDTSTAIDWTLAATQCRALCDGEQHWLSALANTSAMLAELLENINWVGFYLSGSLLDSGLPSSQLILGPFQGKVACTRIPWGRGVCGTAAAHDTTLRIDDVHTFAGHIACDSASRSEIVIPLHASGRVIGVLDIDSPSLARFSEHDQAGLESCIRAIEESITWKIFNSGWNNSPRGCTKV